MAASSEGRALTEAHRVEQQKIRAEFLIAFLELWPLLNTERLDATAPGWVSAVLALIRRFRLRSAEASTRYFIEFGAAEAPAVARTRLVLPPGVERPAPAVPRSQAPSRAPSRASAQPSRSAPRTTPTQSEPTPSASPRTSRTDTRAITNSNSSAPASSREGGRNGDRRVRFDFDESAFRPRTDERRTRIEVPDIDWTPSDRAARVSLTVTGPIAQKKSAAAGKTPEQARKDSLVQASGAASRHVLTGGRQSLVRLAQDDNLVKGWVRVTDGDPCAFCAMLASRGAVFKQGSFSKSDPRWEGPGTVKVHDNCACTIEQIYVTDPVLPGRATEFRKMWDDNIKGNYSGKDALRAWRRLYEAKQKEQRDTGAA